MIPNVDLVVIISDYSPEIDFDGEAIQRRVKIHLTEEQKAMIDMRTFTARGGNSREEISGCFLQEVTK